MKTNPVNRYDLLHTSAILMAGLLSSSGGRGLTEGTVDTVVATACHLMKETWRVARKENPEEAREYGEDVDGK